MRARLCQGLAVGEEQRDGFTPALMDHKDGRPGSLATLMSSPWPRLGQRHRLVLERLWGLKLGFLNSTRSPGWP